MPELTPVRRAELPDHPRSSVVTGGASGIGLGIVRHLLALGGSVVAVDRDAQACASARAALAEFGDRVRVVEADIGSEQGAASAVDAALQAFGSLDLLCNNAAYHPLETIEAHKLDTWRETFRVNVDGTMLCCRAAIPAMRQQGYGTIVNIGSVSGVSPYATGARLCGFESGSGHADARPSRSKSALRDHRQLHCARIDPSSSRSRS